MTAPSITPAPGSRHRPTGPLRAWRVSVEGYGDGVLVARSRGAAKWRCVYGLREVGACRRGCWPKVTARRWPCADAMAEIGAYHHQIVRFEMLPEAWQGKAK